MALQLDLDYALTIISEPGFHQRFSSRKLIENLDATDLTSNKGFWADPETGTLMLYPMQFEKNWLNSASQFDYIVGLDELIANPTDLANKTIYQANYQQNQYNPWIFHGPASPAASVPLSSLAGQISLTDLADETELALSLTGFPGAPVGPPGATSDMKVLCYTADDLPGNQPVYLRWHVGKEAAGHATVYTFCIGQFAVVCGPTHVEIHEDISPAKDRTAWARIASDPLFALGPRPGAIGTGGVTGVAGPSEGESHDRSLFWLPYRRNQVLLISHTRRSFRFLARGVPVLNGLTAPDQDYDIVKPAKLLVAALTPGPSWFQLQKVKWRDGPVQFPLPVFTIDYAPASALTGSNLIDDADIFHGTTLSHGTPSTPAGYENRSSHALDDCEAVTTDGTAQTRTYGVTYTFDNAADTGGLKVWTPFFYAVDIRVPAVSATWTPTTTTLQDTTAGGTSPIAHAAIVSSLAPGEGRAEVRIHDKPPLALAAEYYRSNYPVRLFDGATTLFTGISEPNLVEPLRFDTAIMREITITARDLWKWLEDTTLRDQRDWTGIGHIRVVRSIVEQAGISTAGADTPALDGSYDTPLGGTRSSIEEITNELRPGWAPRDDPPDTAATYIKRIADQFANFAVGFYPDGTFYYLPRNPYLYTSSEATFYKSKAANPSGPCYETVEWEQVEPEANVVQVTAHHSTDGSRLRSAVIKDYGSILNSGVVNFLGRPKTPKEPLVINAAFPCAELNRIARVLFDELRRRHLKGRFRADYVPGLKVGRLCTLEGQPGLYRVLSYRAEYIRTGFKKAQYEVELDEKGYGLP